MAKRVKWENEKGSRFYTAVLVTDDLCVRRDEGCFVALTCDPRGKEFGLRNNSFKTLGAAKRYCIREAKKLHKLVGTQLTELERGENK